MSGTNEEKPAAESSKLRIDKNVAVTFKLNGKNYSLWSCLMKVTIRSRRGYSHIHDEPPEKTTMDIRIGKKPI